jgi:hypothetical protein
MESSKKENITWTNLSDGKGTFGGAGNAYGTKGIPLYILIDKEGIIVEKWTGFNPGIFEEKLSRYLKN